MSVKTIGLIGAGHIGSQLARLSVQHGYDPQGREHVTRSAAGLAALSTSTMRINRRRMRNRSNTGYILNRSSRSKTLGCLTKFKCFKTANWSKSRKLVESVFNIQLDEKAFKAENASKPADAAIKP